MLDYTKHAISTFTTFEALLISLIGAVKNLYIRT